MIRPAIVAALLATAAPAQAYKVFVSNERGNTVTVLDGATWEVLAEFPAGNRPRGRRSTAFSATREASACSLPACSVAAQAR